MLCFIGIGIIFTVMRLYLCLAHPLLHASGKDKTMKKTPKTPIEFDYDLWTTADGKCMVRVKFTGQVTEVDRDVMRILRAEEKRLRRSFTTSGEDEKHSNSVLSVDMRHTDDEAASTWLVNAYDMEDDVLTSIMENEFISLLTEYQREVYMSCMKDGMTCKEFAARHGNTPQGVHQTVTLIRVRAKEFFKNI